jgi:hypothetical protein
MIAVCCTACHRSPLGDAAAAQDAAAAAAAEANTAEVEADRAAVEANSAAVLANSAAASVAIDDSEPGEQAATNGSSAAPASSD